jgi:hypothetical protein
MKTILRSKFQKWKLKKVLWDWLQVEKNWQVKKHSSLLWHFANDEEKKFYLADT